MLADVYLAVQAHAGLVGVEHAIGAEYLDVMSAPPRVVWVPTTDAIISGQGRRNTTAKEPKSLLTRRAGVRIRCWAKAEASDDSVDEVRAVEELVRRVLVAIHETCFGSYEATGVEWIGGDGQEVAQFGRCADIVCTFEVPVTKDASALATLAVITTAEMTGETQFPNSVVSATPSP